MDPTLLGHPALGSLTTSGGAGEAGEAGECKRAEINERIGTLAPWGLVHTDQGGDRVARAGL